MKITLINGSPKRRESASQRLLQGLSQMLQKVQADVCGQQGKQGQEVQEAAGKADTVELLELHFCTGRDLTPEALQALEQADRLVFACPLYVDGIPSQLLEILCQLEQRKAGTRKGGNSAFVYAIMNSGFIEGIQNANALEQWALWAPKAGFQWGCGLGFGGGGALSQMNSIPLGVGPKKSLGEALEQLARNVLAGGAMENLFTSVDISREEYQTVAEAGWRTAAAKRGVSEEELSLRL